MVNYFEVKGKKLKVMSDLRGELIINTESHKKQSVLISVMRGFFI